MFRHVKERVVTEAMIASGLKQNDAIPAGLAHQWCGVERVAHVNEYTLEPGAALADRSRRASDRVFGTATGCARDVRLDRLATVFPNKKKVPTHLEFVDIAGLVEHAAEGEGMGNQFLSEIRTVDAIVHVVRCFEDANVAHEKEPAPGSLKDIG